MRLSRAWSRWITGSIAISQRRQPWVLHQLTMSSTAGSPSASVTVLPSSRSNVDILDLFAHLRSHPRQVLLLDGGTGEELFRRNVPDDRKIWSATALVYPQYHDVLRDVHLSFLKSGSNAITTNSFGVIPGVGFAPEEISKHVALAGQIARNAVQQYHYQQQQKHYNLTTPCFVLGSVGPLVESYRADLILPHDEGVTEYQRACTALAPYVDAYLAETMSCIDESLQVLDAVTALVRNEKVVNRPLLISYTLNSHGNFRNSEPVCQGLRKLLKEARAKREDVTLLVVLFNCCEPEALAIALERIRADKELVRELRKDQILLGAYANRLTAVDDQNWTMESSDAAQPFRSDLDEKEYWSEFVEKWIDDFGVQVVGGCCGIAPEHIAYIHSELKKRSLS